MATVTWELLASPCNLFALLYLTCGLPIGSYIITDIHATMSLQNQKKTQRQISKTKDKNTLAKKSMTKMAPPALRTHLMLKLQACGNHTLNFSNWVEIDSHFRMSGYRRGLAKRLQRQELYWGSGENNAGTSGKAIIAKFLCFYETVSERGERSRISAGRATKLGFFLTIPEQWRWSAKGLGNAREGSMSEVWNSFLWTWPLSKSGNGSEQRFNDPTKVLDFNNKLWLPVLHRFLRGNRHFTLWWISLTTWPGTWP